jgi:hypothetical protein
MQSQPLRELHEHVAPLAPEARPQISLRSSDRLSRLASDQFSSNKPSIGGRMFRAFARFCIAVSIGVSATLAWQLYGDKAEKTVGIWYTSLDRLLPVSASAQNIPPRQSVPTAQISVPSAAVSSSEMAQQLKTLTSDLADAQRSLGQLTELARDVADTRRNLEQLTARQEQIAESLATLQKFEQDVKQRQGSAPQSRSVPLPPRKPPLPTSESSAVRASSVPSVSSSTQQPLPLR